MKNRTLLSVNLSVSATENPVSMHTACKRNEMLDIIPFSWGPMNTGHRHEKLFIRTHWWYTNKNVGDMIYYGYWLLVMWPTMAIDYWWCDLLWLLITSDIIYCGYWLPVIWSTVAIDYQWYDLLGVFITSDMIYCGYSDYYFCTGIFQCYGTTSKHCYGNESLGKNKSFSNNMLRRKHVLHDLLYIHYTLLFSCTIFPLIICCTLIYHKLHINIEFCVL